MPDHKDQQTPREEEFCREIGAKEERKQRARGKRGLRDLWFGLGVFGIVGWSVAIPTVALTALGVWLDNRTDSQSSWTLTLLFVGVVIGCLNAWFWIRKGGHSDSE
jgi:ATP synthase protein I